MDATRMRAYAVEPGTLREEQVRLGLWMFLGTVTMLFAAFASAYIVRRSGSDWRSAALPRLMSLNTIVLSMSSVALEVANRRGRARRWRAAASWSMAALTLGVAFLMGQVIVWRQMIAAGLYLASNPYSSFVYMMSGAHAVHVVAALLVLAWGTVVTARADRDARGWEGRFEVCRTFWHYLTAVWVFVFAFVSIY